MAGTLRIRLYALAAAVVLVMLPVWAVAAGEPLRIVFEDYPPYEFRQSGAATGVNVAIVRAICERLSLQPVFESEPWKRALHMVEHGEADAIMSLFRTEERERFLAFPDVGLTIERNVLLTARQHPFLVRDWEDLRGLSVGVVAGNSYGARFDTADWINKQPVTGSELLLRKQANTRTDVAVSNEWVARYLMRQLGLEEQLLLLDFVVSEEPLFIGFSKAKGDAAARHAQQFSVVIRQLRDEGVIDSLIRDSGLPQPSQRQP